MENRLWFFVVFCGFLWFFVVFVVLWFFCGLDFLSASVSSWQALAGPGRPWQATAGPGRLRQALAGLSPYVRVRSAPACPSQPSTGPAAAIGAVRGWALLVLIVSHSSLSVYKAPLVFDSFDSFLGSDCSMKIRQLHMVNNQIPKEHIAIREWTNYDSEHERIHWCTVDL